MPRLIPILSWLLCLSQAVSAADVQALPDCNLLGREIALRAAEQMPQLPIDAEARNQLAALAETACLEQAASAAAPAPATPATAAEAAAPEVDAGGGLFDFEIIDPQERVRRPSLKRR